MTEDSNPLETNNLVTEEPSTGQLEFSPTDLSADRELKPQEDASTAPAPPSAELTQVLEAIQSLSAEFQRLQQGFDSKIKYDSSKERVIDTLHKELQVYREGMHLTILRPIFLDLIAMHDDLGNLLAHTREEPANSESETRLRKSLQTFQDTIEGILDRNGVEAYSEEGGQFVAQRQRVIRTVNTDIREKDRLVAERIRKGFAYEEKILRPEIVRTFKFIEKSQAD